MLRTEALALPDRVGLLWVVAVAVVAAVVVVGYVQQYQGPYLWDFPVLPLSVVALLQLDRLCLLQVRGPS